MIKEFNLPAENGENIGRQLREFKDRALAVESELEPTSVAGSGRRGKGEKRKYIKREESGRVNKKLDRSWEQMKVRGAAVLLGVNRGQIERTAAVCEVLLENTIILQDIVMGVSDCDSVVVAVLRA
jgi:hypothetical protein